MKLKNFIAAAASAALLSGLPLPASAAAQDDKGFTAMQGIEAEALSAGEMQAIAGELNAYDIAAALFAKAATLGAYPRLQAAVLKLANYYTTNATAINALFAKLNILTPCQSCP
jgi:hypothetical protein